MTRRATEGTGFVTLRFANGCVGEAIVSHVLKDPRLASGWDVMPIGIFGRAGSIRMDWDDTITVTPCAIGGEVGVDVFQIHPTLLVGVPRPPIEGMAGAIDHLLDCLRGGKQPLTHGEDAQASLELVEAAYRSIHKGRAIALPLGDGGPRRHRQNRRNNTDEGHVYPHGFRRTGGAGHPLPVPVLPIVMETACVKGYCHHPPARLS